MTTLKSAKDHIEIGKNLDLIDFAQAAVVSGTRFVYIKNDLALLQNALHQYLLSRLVQEGFVQIIPPLLVKEAALFGTSHFPADQSQVYEIKTDEDKIEDRQRLYLIGSAEPALFAYYKDRKINVAELPIKMFALTPCFRSEAGSWGKDVRGLKRMHQFDKLEMTSIVHPDDGNQMMDYFLGINEWLLRTLLLPYRVLKMCTADLGYFAASRKYDVEVWLSSQQEFMEVMSNTNTTDYQARRLNIRLQGSTDYKYPFTVNDTGVAMGRVLLSIMDNYQRPDGKVDIPKVLQPYMFGRKILGGV